MLKKQIEHQEKVAKFSLGDFTDMFSYHHLQIQEVFGDYNFSRFHIKNSPRMIIISKKVQLVKYYFLLFTNIHFAVSYIAEVS